MNTIAAESLLEAYREPAAVLDGGGRVVLANTRFTGLSVEGALAGERFVPGSDYLETCALVCREGWTDAFRQGVRDVLTGKAESFKQEYACGGASPCCFEIDVRAYRDGERSGALVIHGDVTAARELAEASRKAQERLDYVSELMPDGYWEWDIPSGNCYLSPRWCESLGYEKDELPHHIDTWLKLLHPDDLGRVQAALTTYWERKTGFYQAEDRLKMKDGSYRWSLDQGRVLSWDADGKPLRMVGIDINIHDRKMAELTIQEQARRITEISTPLIPITDDVVVMPLVGVIDPNRAQQILSSLLEGLSQRRAKVAILDITGVSDMDTHVASVLVNVARAVQLLGARVILTGVRPEVAMILVRFEIDWGSIVVRSTLQSGIAHATGARDG